MHVVGRRAGTRGGADQVTDEKRVPGAGEMLDLLRGRFPPPEFALLPTVRNRTGFGGEERYADAVAISVWPSRGYSLHGFEIKTSRSDWLRELRNPGKADAIFSYCDRWWLVVPEPKIVELHELPKTWGLLVAKGRGLTTLSPAPALSPKVPGLPFLASVLRRASQIVVPDAKLAEARERGRKEERDGSLVQDLRRRLGEAAKAVDEFEAASGVRISSWNAGQVGKAVRAVLNNEHVPALKDLARMRTAAEGIKREIDAVVGPDGELLR